MGIFFFFFICLYFPSVCLYFCSLFIYYINYYTQTYQSYSYMAEASEHGGGGGVDPSNGFQVILPHKMSKPNLFPSNKIHHDNSVAEQRGEARGHLYSGGNFARKCISTTPIYIWPRAALPLVPPL